MDIQRKASGELESQITITLHPADYKDKYEKEIQKATQKAAIKGFRKGKVPASVVKKMYGGSIFAELIDNLFNSKLSDYLREEKINFVTQPILSEDQERLSLLPNDTTKSYTITYEIGELPDYEVKGISPEDTYNYYIPAPPADFVDKELTYIAKRGGNMEEVEDILGEELITVTASEMENGEIKEGGLSKDVILFYNSTDEELKKTLLTKKLNDTFTVEVGKLENQDLNYIKKNLFGLPEDYDLKADDVFHYSIKKIMRMKPIELTDEVIKEKFNIENLEALKEAILENFNANNEPSSRYLFTEAVKKNILEQTDFRVSESFLKKWLAVAEKLDQAKIDEQIAAFKTDLKWTYIKDEIAKLHNITLDSEDIRIAASDRIRGYEQQYGQSFSKDTVQRLVESWYADKTEYYKLNEEAKSRKIFMKLYDVVKKDEVKLSMEEYEKLFLQNKEEN
jgi:trigger factor